MGAVDRVTLTDPPVTRVISECRVCGGTKLTPIWSKPDMRIVEFPEIGKPPQKPPVPLELLVCQGCWLMQLRHTTNSKLLYEEFWYRSGINEAMRIELNGIALAAVLEGNVQSGDWVLDIGCNDWTLLNFYRSLLTVNCIGFDPAENIERKRVLGGGAEVHVRNYFSAELAKQLLPLGKKFKAITAIAMFYDLDDPVSFCKEVTSVLDDEGVFIVQMNYGPKMIANNCVDNVVHEHLTYFSLSSLIYAFEQAGLYIYKTEQNPTNGGSIRVYATKKKDQAQHGSVNETLRRETCDFRIREMRTYHRFSERVITCIGQIDKWIEEVAESRAHMLYAYGASTRGFTLLQLLRKSRLLKACAERDERKWGRYIPDVEIPIVSEAEFRDAATHALILPYHFYKGIMRREEAWLAKGGKFLVPLPSPFVSRQGDI